MPKQVASVTFGIRPNASCFYTIFTLVNEGTDMVQRRESAPEHITAITAASLNPHQNSFVQGSFSGFHVIAAPASSKHAPQTYGYSEKT